MVVDVEGAVDSCLDDEIDNSCHGGGGEEVITRLYERYRTSIISIALSVVGDVLDSEDITQRVFLNVYNNLEKIMGLPREEIWSYIKKAAYNESIYLLRKKRRSISTSNFFGDQEVYDHVFENINSGEPLIEDILGFEDFLKTGLSSIPAKFRSIFYSRFWDDLSYKDIADRHGIPIGTVRSRINRGRIYFKSALIRRFSEELEDYGLG